MARPYVPVNGLRVNLTYKFGRIIILAARHSRDEFELRYDCFYFRRSSKLKNSPIKGYIDESSMVYIFCFVHHQNYLSFFSSKPLTCSIYIRFYRYIMRYNVYYYSVYNAQSMFLVYIVVSIRCGRADSPLSCKTKFIIIP